MSLKGLKKLIDSFQESEAKRQLQKKLAIAEKDTQRLEARYLKANEDKLTLSHLLSKVNNELEESLGNEKRFVASISHELRTPLTAILGYSELLNDTALNNKQKKYLENIVQSSDHLLALISDLLDVSKLEDNRIELSLKELDLDEVLNDCATLIRSKIHADVTFDTDIPILDYPVISDEKRIKQIFINLLSNASKFTKKGSIKFYVKSMEDLPDNRLKLVVNVDDTGSGIPAEVADSLFEPFKSTDKTQGTGLGLYISRQLSRLMDGDIDVESNPGVGSSFSVTIVVKKSARKEVGKALKNANIMMFSPQNTFTEKVTQELLKLSVNFQNYCVANADIKSSLIQMIASGPFYDAAIFDMDMYKNHTSSIAGTLKAVNPNIKLIALADENSDKQYGEFDKVLFKPVPYQRFIRQLEMVYSEEYFARDEGMDYSKLNILIVEDVELNREYEKEMLNNFFSISCDTAIHGKEAVEKARANTYDAILMDMRMPVMDGLEATRRIRSFDAHIPIICMSANVYKEDKLAAEEAGMNDFIEKPLSKQDIENKLVKLINNEFARENTQQPDAPSAQAAPKPSTETTPAQTASLPDFAQLQQHAMEHLTHNFNPDIAQRLFAKAVESIAQYLGQIDTHFDAKDTDALAEDFHALKGVCSNVGFDGYAAKAGALQKIAENGDLLLIFKEKQPLIEALRVVTEGAEHA